MNTPLRTRPNAATPATPATAQRDLHQIDIAITLLAPWLVHGTDPGKFGLDATLMRNHQGKPMLPGSLVQGRLRHAWVEMTDDFGLQLPSPDDWFGKAGHALGLRGRLMVNDLVMSDAPDEALLMNTRVAMDAETGAAKTGMLLMMEQVYPPGTPVTFKGQWHLWGTDQEAKLLRQAIASGLMWQSQLGAQRSVGFGRLQSATVNIKKVTNTAAAAAPKADRFRLTLQFDRPICVGASSLRGNVFVSDDKISGGTLKGAMATLLQHRHGQTVAQLKTNNKLAQHFDALRVTHAFPSNNAKRPSAIPLSLVSMGDTLLDCANLKEPHLIEGQSPSFFHDWKPALWGKVCAQQGWGSSQTHLRVRTAIDKNTRAAQEGDLFAYECRVADENTRWLADVSLADVPQADRQAVAQALADLLQNGLGPIGKTDAWAQVAFSDEQAMVWEETPISQGAAGFVRVQLNTPALLLATSQIVNLHNPDLQKLYADIFKTGSGGSLVLSHYYACHSMAGGGFLHARHGQPNTEANPGYQPFVLTDAGSVFVFTVTDTVKAQKTLSQWQASGLPLSPAVVAERGESWQANPYGPQNGFGEIAVNLQHGFATPQPQVLSAC
ncbi:MAG: hypothetical protein RLZZ352_1709 [Pseudomonadota bacterium]|jgi:hypothetical protein